jgi:serine/threonine protein kinase
MLQAVHVIHEEKIVHSDLKPANFVLVRGQLKLIDFGIANAIANDTTNIQRDHQVRSSSVSYEHCLNDGLDRYFELYEPGGHRITGWNAPPQGGPSERRLVPGLHPLPNDIRANPIPSSVGLPKDEGNPRLHTQGRVSRTRYTFNTHVTARNVGASAEAGPSQETCTEECDTGDGQLPPSGSQGEIHNS